MNLSRRDMLTFSLGTLGLYLAGCASDKNQLVQRPGPSWPDALDRPAPTGPSTLVRPPAAQVPPPPAVPPAASPDTVTGPLAAIPRSQWAKAPPIPTKILAMGRIERITVHHEGWTSVQFTDVTSTAQRLESIRRSHLDRLGAGDIGYHFVIDRAGRVWQGRDLRYQGAHVREYNPHNIGVMCLGNFDTQRPTDAQYASLQRTLRSLLAQYKVPVNYLYTHQELNKTECPGTALQGHMVALRRGKTLVA